MKVKDVVTLKEVADDLNDGKTFYDQREAGVYELSWYELVDNEVTLKDLFKNNN